MIHIYSIKRNLSLNIVLNYQYDVNVNLFKQNESNYYKIKSYCLYLHHNLNKRTNYGNRYKTNGVLLPLSSYSESPPGEKMKSQK